MKRSLLVRLLHLRIELFAIRIAEQLFASRTDFASESIGTILGHLLYTLRFCNSMTLIGRAKSGILLSRNTADQP